MYVITRHVQVNRDQQDAMRTHWEQNVLPVIQQQDGYHTAYLMQNDSSVMIVLLWESADAEKAWHDSAEHKAIDGWMKDYAAKLPVQKGAFDRVTDYR